MSYITKKLLTIFIALIAVFTFSECYALTDLSIIESDISFSKDEPFENDTVRIYARVFNVGDIDVYGHVSFLIKGKELGDPQPISLKANTYDDVFIDWKPKAGAYDIEAKIIGLSLKDDNLGNNATIRKNYFVDLDTDGDGIGDSKDLDDDNDGVPDEEEFKKGTDEKKADTDNDGFNDNIDVFPKDKTEWQDTDQDEIGNNKDTDNDNDGLTDYDEVHIYATNPLNADSDNDGLNDKKELEMRTLAMNPDSDGDGESDFYDPYPLDPNKMSASLMGALEDIFGKDFLNSSDFWMGCGVFAVILFFLYLWWRRRRRMRD